MLQVYAKEDKQKTRLTLYVLVDDIFQPVESLYNPQSFALLVALQLPDRDRHRDFNIHTGDVVRDPSDIEQTHDVGHAAQDHTCRHQSFGSPRARHAVMPACSASASAAGAPRTSGTASLFLLFSSFFFSVRLIKYHSSR